MSEFLYVPPYLRWDLFGVVSASNVDTDSDAQNLVDGKEKWPLRLTTNNGTITITNTAGTVSLVAVTHHLLSAGATVTFGGDISGSLTMPSYPRNGVPLNKAALITAVPGVTSVDLTIAGNGSDLLIGETVIGEYLTLDPPIRIAGSQFREPHYGNDRSNPLSGIPPYSDRARSRPLVGSQYYSTVMRDLILEWWDSQDAYAYPVPSLIIPDSDDLSDVRLVMLAEPTYTQVGPEDSDVQWLVNLEFTELPRTRW